MTETVVSATTTPETSSNTKRRLSKPPTKSSTLAREPGQQGAHSSSKARLRNWRLQKFLLLVASYAFYAAWNPPFVVLLWISTLIDWFAAKRMHTEERRSRRIALLCVSLAANLGLLGFFKYGGFVLENFQNVVGFYGMTFEAAKPNIILPVGISFYTFQTLSYTLDVFLRRSKPSRSFLDFALYVTFFPQLVAGPIVRATHFLPQCLTPRRATRSGRRSSSPPSGRWSTSCSRCTLTRSSSSRTGASAAACTAPT